MALLLARHSDVVELVAGQLDPLAKAVDAAWYRLRDAPGRLVYVGSGTPGLLLQADAAELGATFGWPPQRLLMLRPTVANEDAGWHGSDVATDARLSHDDVVVAASASGATPFTLRATEVARSCRALTVAFVANPASPLVRLVDHPVQIPTGAEPIAGSTRMRAGLAQKLVVTAFSTALMIRLGRTYDNLMVSVGAGLDKLRSRQEQIVGEVCSVPPEAARELLHTADGQVDVALVVQLAGVDVRKARAALESGAGVRAALLALRPDR